MSDPRAIHPGTETVPEAAEEATAASSAIIPSPAQSEESGDVAQYTPRLLLLVVWRWFGKVVDVSGIGVDEALLVGGDVVRAEMVQLVRGDQVAARVHGAVAAADSKARDV